MGAEISVIPKPGEAVCSGAGYESSKLGGVGLEGQLLLADGLGHWSACGEQLYYVSPVCLVHYFISFCCLLFRHHHDYFYILLYLSY